MKMEHLRFVSPKGSDKNKEVVGNPSVRLNFHGSAHSDLMYLIGEASIHEDKSKIKEIWNPFLKHGLRKARMIPGSALSTYT
jgi:general stress protein 26